MLVLAVLAFGLAACTEEPPMEEELAADLTPRQEPGVIGADGTVKGDSDVAPGPNQILVGLSDFAIDMPATLDAGETTFLLENRGSVEHSFEVEGQGTERELETPIPPGGSGTLTVDLRPGTYRVYCPVEDHASRGMELALQVTESTVAPGPEEAP